MRDTTESPYTARFTSLLLMGILLLAWWVRIWNLDAQSFWNDEGYGVYLAHQGWSAMTWDDIVHPPLFTYLLHVWLQLGEEEWVLRWLPAAFGVIAVAAIYAAGKRIAGKPVALLGALLAAVAPQLVYYSQEVRPYMAGVALGWLAVAALVRVVGTQSEDASATRHLYRNAFLFALFTALSCMTLYFSALLAAGAGVWALWMANRRDSDHPLRMGIIFRVSDALIPAFNLRSVWRRVWWLATLPVAVLFAIWGSITVRVILPIISIRGPVYGNHATPPLDFLSRSVTGWAVGPATTFDPAAWLTQPVVLALLLLAAAGILLPAALRDAAVSRLLLLPAMLCVPPMLLWLIDQRFPNFQPRYMIVSAPALYLLAATGAVSIASLFRTRRRLLDAGCAALLCGGLLLLWWSPLHTLWFDPKYARDDYRGMVAAIADRAAPDDAMVLDAYWQEGMVGYYTQRDNLHLPVYGFPTEYPLDEAKADRRLQEITATHTGVWLVLYGQGSLDPQNYVENWLDRHAKRGDSRWYGEARLVRYDLPQGPLPLLEMGIQLGPLTLAGFDAGPAVAGGSPVPLRLAWRIDQPLQQAPQVSVRLVDAENRIWAQSDYPLGGISNFVMAEQPQGQTFLDAPALSVPAGTPAGKYRIELVAYTAGGQLGVATPGEVEVDAPSSLTNLAALRRSMPVHIDQAFGSQVLVGSFQLAPTHLKPGDLYTFDFLWLSADGQAASNRLSVELADAQGTVLAQDEEPLEGSGRFVRTRGSVRVPPDAGDGVLTVRLSLLDASGNPQPVRPATYWDDWQHPLIIPVPGSANLRLATVDVKGRARNYMLPADLGQVRGERFGNGIELAGMKEDHSTPGILRLTLIWRCLGPVGGDYKVFTHLLDAQNQVVGQDDQVPLHGNAPTSTWRKGEVLVDQYDIRVPASASYQIEIGFYDPQTNKRLPAGSATGTPLGDSLFAGEITVGR